MNSLTKRKYFELSKLANEEAAKRVAIKKWKKRKGESDFNCWKRNMEGVAYPAYLNHPCRTKEDLFKIAGLAYSWMPTMLDLYSSKEDDWEDLMSLVKKFRNGKLSNTEDRKVLAKRLSSVINNSIVGTSKVLHIINPELAPLIDSRVIRYWNKFFRVEIKNGSVAGMPSNLNLASKNAQKKIDSYIEYWDLLSQWRKTLNYGVSLREIEVKFYLLGDPSDRKKK